jgi:hypothetical protein
MGFKVTADERRWFLNACPEKADMCPKMLEADMEFTFMMNGNDKIMGRNDTWLKIQMQRLSEIPNRSTEEDKELRAVQVELGLVPDGSGRRKPKTCWQFVKYGRCGCPVDRQIGNNKWHPDEAERLYLKQKLKLKSA